MNKKVCSKNTGRNDKCKIILLCLPPSYFQKLPPMKRKLQMLIKFLGSTRSMCAVGLVGILFVTGCANPINARTGERYYTAGMAAEENEELVLARKNYSRAYANAQVGFLGPTAEAYSLYEWSRVTGYLGNYSEAEKGFLDVLDLIEKAKGKADKLRSPALCEYARLLYDTDQHSKAASIFERAVGELEMSGALKIDPLGYASFLEDYSRSLAAVKSMRKSAEVERKAQAIRASHQDAKPAVKQRRYINH
jgi:tetratricopeptide (TPR) repeat protein